MNLDTLKQKMMEVVADSKSASILRDPPLLILMQVGALAAITNRFAESGTAYQDSFCKLAEMNIEVVIGRTRNYIKEHGLTPENFPAFLPAAYVRYGLRDSVRQMTRGVLAMLDIAPGNIGEPGHLEAAGAAVCMLLEGVFGYADVVESLKTEHFV